MIEYMAELNMQFYSGEDYYSDGTIEDKIYEGIKAGKNCIDFSAYEEKEKFAAFYHLSQIRENILNWYPFQKNAELLEIGAGCGAITGLLCRKVMNVTSVELSKKRSEINFERNKKYPNLEIIVGNLNDITFEKKYDYIVLNGVLEYAMSFTNTENPYSDFLSNILVNLKENGVLLIAIENRLGLKYFNGAVEDHTDNILSLIHI